jgi:hypothetical protein
MCHGDFELIDADIENRIMEELLDIEERNDVSILFACESGSRAWGFPSQDSDYDVRFIYVHKKDWYLQVDNVRQRDVIEKPIDDELDVSGWELRKALNLLKKSNPALIEWINSPIVYRKDDTFHSGFRDQITECYSPKACFYHYSHMANGNNRSYLQGEIVRVKKYFYVLRPILAMKWIEQDMGIVPTEFESLVNAVVDDSQLLLAINQLLDQKKAGFESKDMPRIDIISNFITAELKRFSKLNEKFATSDASFDSLNEFFLETLNQVYT